MGRRVCVRFLLCAYTLGSCGEASEGLRLFGPRQRNAAARARMASPAVTGKRLPEIHQQVNAASGRIPLRFEENRGQADAHVRYVSRGNGYSLSVTRSGFELAAGEETLQMTLAGGNRQPVIQGEGRLEAVSHYLVGSNPAGWRTGFRIMPESARTRFIQVLTSPRSSPPCWPRPSLWRRRSNTVVAAPAVSSVTLTPGAISKTFTLSTADVAAASSAAITATANGISAAKTLTVNP